MTHKFCDKCGKRITFDGDPEDCYSNNAKVIVRYFIPMKNVFEPNRFEHKMELDFCDDCLEEFRKSLCNDLTYVRAVSKEDKDE